MGGWLYTYLRDAVGHPRGARGRGGGEGEGVGRKREGGVCHVQKGERKERGGCSAKCGSGNGTSGEASGCELTPELAGE